MQLFDTSVLISLDTVIVPDDVSALSAISEAELQFGIASAASRELQRLRIQHMARIQRFTGSTWLAFDSAAAKGYGRLAAIVARTRPAHARRNDIMLAGHALSLGAKLVTLNEKDFALVADEVELVVPQRRS